MGFKNWISQFKSYDSPIGDLSRDIVNDKDFPTNDKQDELRQYINSKISNNTRRDELFSIAWNFFVELYEQ